jgi:outer membrane protein OmpU
MINLKKLGLSALAGSLVAVSAQAGEMAVTGSANVTYVNGETENSNGSIGTDKDVAFTGSGELDNGYTFVVSTLLTDAMSVSSSYTSLTMGSMGTLNFGTDFGGASYKYDEEVPQAYEQISDAAQTSSNIVGNNMDNNSVVYNSPAFDVSGASISFDLEYAPQASGVSPGGDGSQVAYSDNFGEGMGAGVTVKYAGLTTGAYVNEVEAQTTNRSLARDSSEGVAYIKYAYGPVAVGVAHSYLDSGLAGVQAATTAAKTVRTAAGIFYGTQASIAYNVNDNMSVSYTNGKDKYDSQSAGAKTVEKETDAFQIAYSMGAMSIKAYKMETKNPTYSLGTNAVGDNDLNVTEIALGLAF